MGDLFARLPVAALLILGGAAWGRSVSIDLRSPAPAHRAGRLMAAAARPDDGTLRKVDLDAGATEVGDVDIGDELELTLFDDVKITLRLAERSPSLLAGDVFLAEASGYDGVKNAVVLRTDEGLTVDIQDYLNDRVYKVISTKSGVTIREIEPSKEGVHGHDTLEPPDESAASETDSPEEAKSSTSRRDTLLASGDKTYVDILVAYDKNAVAWANSHGGGINSFAQTAVAKMNTALANTGLNSYFQFRLAGVTTVSVSASDVSDALHAAVAKSYGWERIAQKRDEVGADIVTTLIDTGIGYGTIGVGYALSSSSSLTSFASSAYNACEIRFVSEGHTMTHEVGHNMGAGHATAVNSSEISPGPQLYNYSAAFHFRGNDGEKYHTIMAYNFDGFGNHYKEAPFFSSPSHYYKGVKVGDSTHDNTRTLRNTYSYVAKWRTRKPDFAPHVFTGRGASLVVSASLGKYTYESTFKDSDKLYVSWAFKCSNESVSTSFRSVLYVDDAVRKTWKTSSIAEGKAFYVDEYNIGSLSVGTHTIKVVADAYGEVSELDESNNTVTRTITVTRTPGSCASAAVPFTFSNVVAGYFLPLVREYSSGAYSDTDAAFYASASVSRNRLYTIALPRDSDFTVTCSGAGVTYGYDDSLRYCLIDTRRMSASSAKAILAIHGDIGDYTTVYAVAADYMPMGNFDKPEHLPAMSSSGFFRYDVSRNLRAGEYCFSLDAVAGMRYEMRLSGRTGLAVYISGDVNVLDSASGDGYCRQTFTSNYDGPVSITVSANETGSVSVSWIGVDGARKFTLSLDANGGSSSFSTKKLAYGDKVGTLPSPEREGYVFDGWYTAREGGTRVTASTVMSVANDLSLYARWTALAAASCESAAVGFSVTGSIQTYDVRLVRGWDVSSSRYVDNGCFCAVTTVERGRLYTFAVPVNSGLSVSCESTGVQIKDGCDDNLWYVLLDTRAMCEDRAKAYLDIFGDVGDKVKVYAVAGDYMPLGLPNKPEVLPSDDGDGGFSHKVSRSLRNGCYEFFLSAVPGVRYQLKVAGRNWLYIHLWTDSDSCVIDERDGGDDFDSVTFSSRERCEVWLSVSADETGPVDVEWSGARDDATLRLRLDGNGGNVDPDWIGVQYGCPIGDMPNASLDGCAFAGWYTRPSGGEEVTSDTIVDFTDDFTVYARWQSLVRGSCFEAPVRFDMTKDIRSYNVRLTGEWDCDESKYSKDIGVLYCATTLERGRIYTLAMPHGSSFDVDCDCSGLAVEVSYGDDDALSYALIDARHMSVDTATAFLCVTGYVGQNVTVHAVAADYMPLGSAGKPEVLPARVTNDDGYFFYEVPRSLRNGRYDFTLDAIPGIVYELSVSGRAGLSISLEGDSDGALSILDSSDTRNSAHALFSSPDGGAISISVSADTTGQISVEWSGSLE